MQSQEMRKKFFDFFVKHGHTKVESSSLVPAEDPTLLFTNAGMNQFKDVFLGTASRSYTRAVTIQKCMRAGGKHNDLDNVGMTSRHLTLFEMMGNFSFGDYFKKDAIQFAWNFLVDEMQFDISTMYVTVFYEDQESYDIWQQTIGLSEDKIIRLGAADNFWQMGETGPCGPCTEIYVDRGEKYGCKQKTCAPGCSCDRFLEVWNLVFMQYNRQPDGTDKPLQRKGVDTGMGLERLCMIMHKKDSVFETDLFWPMIQKAEQLTAYSYESANHALKSAFNVLADHVRSSTFLIADGITPSNEGRGYVLRKIIRRAALFMQRLTNDNILPELANVVIATMKDIYPNLVLAEKSVIHILTVEVEKFAQNLSAGQRIIKRLFQQEQNSTIFSGHEAFKLYDTYGFPLELTKVLAHEHGFTVDIEGFEKEMEKQRERSGGVLTKTVQEIADIPETWQTEFTGYVELETKTSIVGLLKNDRLLEEVPAGEACWVITKQSPFYVEKGGQVSDEGWIIVNGHAASLVQLKRLHNTIAAEIIAPTTLEVGQEVICKVDKEFRLAVMNNHTATHLLQAALISVLGKGVKQSGSLVHPDYLRFDFTYHKPMTHEEIELVERMVNEKIRENIPLDIYQTSYKNAIEQGVIAIFGEKYNPEEVRVINIPTFSMELCGGTHVVRTGDIGCFKITEESALSTGQRRIVALTGVKAVELYQQTFDIVKNLSQEFKAPFNEVLAALAKQQEQLKEAQQIIKEQKKKLWQHNLVTLLQETTTVNNVSLGIFSVDDLNQQEMKDIAQRLVEQKLGLYFLYTAQDNKMLFTCAVPAELSIDIQQIKTLLQERFDLRSGLKGIMLQGGGKIVGRDALQKIFVEVVEKKL